MTTPLPIQFTGQHEFVLAACASSVAEARVRMAEVAERLVDPSRMGDLQLALSEVVGNAVRHGSRGGPIKLVVTPKLDYLCVQVTDRGPGLGPRPNPTAPGEHGGWGFFLIEQLSRRWGITREDGCTRVWFEFDF